MIADQSPRYNRHIDPGFQLPDDPWDQAGHNLHRIRPALLDILDTMLQCGGINEKQALDRHQAVAFGMFDKMAFGGDDSCRTDLLCNIFHHDGIASQAHNKIRMKKHLFPRVQSLSHILLHCQQISNKQKNGGPFASACLLQVLRRAHRRYNPLLCPIVMQTRFHSPSLLFSNPLHLIK
ncbi:hypothetical protein D3C75_771620 [compost metagenome]